MSTSVAERIAQRIHRGGPIPFDAFVDEALYGDGGFFTGDARRRSSGSRLRHQPRDRPALRRPGRPGVGSLLGRPRRPRSVLRGRGGRGPWAPGRRRARLAASVRAGAALRAGRALRRPPRRAARRAGARAGRGRARPAARGRRRRLDASPRGSGPVATSLPDLPAIPLSGVVFANELLDNLPFRVVERTADGWSEVRVGVAGDAFVEDLVPASDDLAVEAEHVAASSRADRWPPARADRRTRVAPVVRVRPPARRAHRRRLRRDRGGARRAGRARLAAHVPAATSAARRRSSIPGEQDITADVPVEYLVHTASRAGLTLELECTQAEWLRDLGVDDLVADARAQWDERAHIGDLEALRHRSRITEAAALARSRRARRAPCLRVPPAEPPARLPTDPRQQVV